MKTKKRPKITLAYCEELFKKHDVNGSRDQEDENCTASPQITPELLVTILEKGDENAYFYVESQENDFWIDTDGDEREGRYFLKGSILSDQKLLDKLQEEEGAEDSCPPFYSCKEYADHDRDALNAIIREYFGVEPKQRTPAYTSDGFVSRLVLGGETCCPMCGSGEIINHDTDHQNDSTVVSEISCESCHAEWEEVYVIQSYRNLRIP